MQGHNSMKKKAGRPKKSEKGGIPEVSIGGMETTGPLNVNGGILRGRKKGAKK